ncbi:MAG: type II and III secretion system protein [Planctomycetota bacterium]|nr:type II and III secretion system protein [Planctomycetota bacterium]
MLRSLFVLRRSFSIVPVFIDKSDTSMMSVSFKIVTEEGETEKLPPDARPGNLLELTPEDFADPFPNNIVELGGDLKKQLSSLNSLPEDSFVTFFYPLKFMRPSVARNLFSKKLSPWGWIEINDDHSIMVITDYVSYVRSIVESIIVFDKPIPQAQITAKVMEINITDKEARGFVYNFTRTGPDDIDVGASNLFDPNTYYSEGIAGAISHYSGSDYKKFTAALNMVISKGNANVLATPRALALNNQSTDFHVGETYYYLAPDSNSYYVERYDRDDDSGDHTKDRLTENSRFRTIQTGVHLNVRPYLQNSDFIECKIRLSYDEVVGFRGPMELPVAANRSIDSNVRIRDGQTLVIGGLFREKAMTVRKKIPGIGDVPLIKHLFNSKEEEKVKSELVFILTVNRIK